MRPVVGYYGYWVFLTYLGMVSSVTGIYFALGGNIGYAVICLMISGLCDMLDGPVARLKKRNEREKSYGIQVDAFADLISFGALPIVIGYAASPYINEPVSFVMVPHIAISAMYILAALIRLSYFNVIEIELQNKKEKRKYYEGMPVTFVAILIPLIYSLHICFNIDFFLMSKILLVVMSIAFVVKIKIPKLRGRQLLVFVAIGLPIIIYLLWNIRAKM